MYCSQWLLINWLVDRRISSQCQNYIPLTLAGEIKSWNYHLVWSHFDAHPNQIIIRLIHFRNSIWLPSYGMHKERVTKSNKREVSQKLREVHLTLNATRRLNLIYIAKKFHQDILYGAHKGNQKFDQRNVIQKLGKGEQSFFLFFFFFFFFFVRDTPS